MSGNGHVVRTVTHYKPPQVKRAGFVAWCSCGIGSPLKRTERAARASLAVHTTDPREYPQ